MQELTTEVQGSVEYSAGEKDHAKKCATKRSSKVLDTKDWQTVVVAI